MTNLPETDNFDSGVYAIQTTDPVVGQTGGAGAVGIANQGAQNLTNRTRWLYTTLAALQAVVNGLAGLVSPIFTGTPQAPTAAPGTTGTQLATCGFAEAMLNGVSDIDSSAGGTIVLTAAQYGKSILVIQGNPAAAPTILVPNGVSGRWIVRNATTTNVPINFGVVGGASPATIQNGGTGRELWSDAAQIYDARNDFPNTNLIGPTTCPTPTAANQVANKGYVDASANSNIPTGVSGPNGWTRQTNGQIRIWAAVSFNAVANATTTLSFTMPISFTAIPGQCGVSFGGNNPPPGVAISAQLQGLAQIQITVVCPGPVANPLGITYWAEGD